MSPSSVSVRRLWRREAARRVSLRRVGLPSNNWYQSRKVRGRGARRTEAAWWCSGHGGAARRPRRSCVVAQEPRWRGMAAAWRCCAVTEAVAAPCDGHGSSGRHEHGDNRRVCALRLFRVSPAEKKLGVCRRGRRPRPGHAGPAVLIASARGHGHELGRVERGDERVRGRTRSSCSRRPRCLRQCAACA